jgi:hypothetical protein
MLKIYLKLILLYQISTNSGLVFLAENEKCYLNTYTRGIGFPSDSCRANEEKINTYYSNPFYETKAKDMCLPKCHHGYTGHASTCRQNCPKDFHDDHSFCIKPSAYGRGAGYISQASCNADHSQGCERDFLFVYYPKCKEGYHAVGCCICSPDCPDGMTDIGVSCVKKNYHRGYGHTIGECRKDEDSYKDSCYHKCPAGNLGIGPMCIFQTCPVGLMKCGNQCVGIGSCTNMMIRYNEAELSKSIVEVHRVQGNQKLYRQKIIKFGEKHSPKCV